VAPSGIEGIGLRAEVYLTASDVLRRPVGATERRQLLGSVPLDQALNIIAHMLRDTDLTPLDGSDPHLKWAGQTSGSLRSSLLDAISAKRHLLAPQILLLTAIEIISACPSGPSDNNVSGVDEVVTAMLGIAEESGSVPHSTGSTWGSMDVGMAAEIIANSHFNRSASVPHIVTWAQAAWRQGWPTIVPDKTLRSIGGSPSAVFHEATGVTIEDFMSVGVHLWVQAEMHGYVNFPSDFFDRIGIKREAVDLFLKATSADVATIRLDMANERDRVSSPRWAFNTLRRFPIVRLSTGGFLVLKLSFAIERALSSTTYHDVSNYLKMVDRRHGSDRAIAFRTGTTKIFEFETGVTLKRMFVNRLLANRVFDELHMRSAWGSRNRTPSTCDFVVDCGDTWLMVEATERRLPERAVNGSLDAEGLDKELDCVLTERKARQFASTARYLHQDMAKLCGRTSLPGTKLVPVVVVPTEGLGWNEVVYERTVERLAQLGTLQGARVLPVCLMTFRDLRILEALGETGVGAGAFLAYWRTTAPGMPFDHFVLSQMHKLTRPSWETDTFNKVIDELVDRMREEIASHGVS
jgi:hypothetical protein